jgi:hypothetical protein
LPPDPPDQGISIHSWWREIWLEKLSEAEQDVTREERKVA